MKKRFLTSSQMPSAGSARLASIVAIVGLLVAGLMIWNPYGVSANHPVLVEGEKDFDGDGLVGTAEDTDNATDRVFGTITAALAAANGAANQNGRVTVVTSGRFREQVVITGANGNVTLEAAPGVEANIDAILPGDTAGNTVRQAQSGIVVDAPATRIITIANIISRNWTAGVRIVGASRVVLDNCKFENNINHGIRATENTRVTISNNRVTATGFRTPPAGVAPNPGAGIEFEDAATGSIAFTTVSGSAATGIANSNGSADAIRLIEVNVFDNLPNFSGPFRGGVQFQGF